MTITVALFVLLGVGLVLMMLVEGFTRRVDLLSIRNVYLCGFIVYQIISPAAALHTGEFGPFKIVNPEKAGQWMLLFAYAFIAVYLLSYNRIRISRRIAVKFSGRPVTASDSLLIGVALSLVVAALVTRMLIVQLPGLRGIAVNIALALAAASCAIMGWVWGNRRFNPAVLLTAAVVVGTGLVLALTGIYSRRPLISMLAGFTWGAYYRWARKLAPSKLFFSISPLLLAGIVIVSAYTAIRSHEDISAGQRIQKMSQGNISSGIDNLLSGQLVGSAGLWIFDTYPQDIDYKHLFSFRYMAYYWIPRLFWEDKPEPLSTEIATLARLEGVNRNVITLPPGVVCYGAAEGGLYAVVLYALFFGQFTRLFDELIRLNPTNPLIILPVGCAMGNFLGLARGDIAMFTNIIVVSFLATLLLLYLSSRLFGGVQRHDMGAAWSPAG
jgi:hypothetical protein